jgi:hypothetical protein
MWATFFTASFWHPVRDADIAKATLHPNLHADPHDASAHEKARKKIPGERVQLLTTLPLTSFLGTDNVAKVIFVFLERDWAIICRAVVGFIL